MAKNDSIEMLQNKIELLRNAKTEIEDDAATGLCAGLWLSYNLVNGGTYEQLRAYVSKNLKGHVWLDDWIKEHRPGLSTSKANMKRYRLQWIDWLVACLEKDLLAKSKKANKQT